MATPEEIERRIEEKDAPRTAKRSATAKRVSELTQQRAAIAEQLTEIERQLGDVLADAHDVIDMDELAQFTDVPTADLTRWLEARTPTRTRRKKVVGPNDDKSDTGRRTATAKTPVRTPIGEQAATSPRPAGPRTGATTPTAGVMAEVT